jgi:hypothetical protein
LMPLWLRTSLEEAGDVPAADHLSRVLVTGVVRLSPSGSRAG